MGFIAAGFGVGIAVGITGVGGGSLMTPILILLFGFTPAAAVGTDLLYAAGTKGFGTWLHGRQQTVDWHIVGLLALGSLPASLLTVTWLHFVGIHPWVEKLMLIVLSVAIVVTAVLTLFRRRRKTIEPAQWQVMQGQFMFRHRRVVTIACGVGLGVLVTLSSVGAGVLGTAILFMLYPHHRTIEIVGTDIAHAVPLTLVAGVGHLTLGTTHVDVLLWLLAGSLPGIYVGTRLGVSLPDTRLRQLVSVLLVVIGTAMLWDNINVLLA